MQNKKKKSRNDGTESESKKGTLGEHAHLLRIGSLDREGTSGDFRHLIKKVRITQNASRSRQKMMVISIEKVAPKATKAGPRR